MAVDLLHGPEFPRRTRSRLERMVGGLGATIRSHCVPDAWVEGLPVTGFTGKATWYRMFLDRLPAAPERILYLDVDLIVLQPLSALWRTSLDGKVLGAVTNVPQLSDRPYVERPELGGRRYFNAGVLLIDLAWIRHEGLGDELRSFSRRHAGRLHWRDQDVLNEVLGERRLALDPLWNCMNSVMSFPWAADYFSPEALAAARRAPAIRHFEGPGANKPWHLLADRDARRLYLEHRDQTPWRWRMPSGLTPVTLAKLARRRLL